MKIKILFDRVLIEEFPPEETTAGGLVLLSKSQHKPLKGKVILCGNGKLPNGEQVQMSVKENDVILYSEYSGTPIKLDDKQYLMMKDSDILAICDV